MRNELNSAAMLRNLTACQTPQEVIEVVKKTGRELTEQHAAELLEKLQLQTKELSDEELERIAAGDTCSNGIRIVVAGWDRKGREIQWNTITPCSYKINHWECPKHHILHKGWGDYHYCDVCNDWFEVAFAPFTSAIECIDPTPWGHRSDV